ncbi:hypothetical protein HHK36_027373 [Tetracentron sinense]|uniref:Uncharacterized protein n=1 Tax=Tetracentron sinense TaxID=13715 RepID=A0A834YDY5_TETSI|nr:hypothetical protein HHK36_027373 [Tetracentron sinense]
MKMLCSISNSTPKSGSNWLDRLRSTKGFPPANALHDLDHFLQHSNPQPIISDSTTPHQSHPNSFLNGKPVAEDPEKNTGLNKNGEKEDWFDIITSVLAQLFNMGDSCEFRRVLDEKRSSRKQPNPKFCVFSASASLDHSSLDAVPPILSPPSADNSATETKETGEQLKLKKQGNVASITLEDDSSTDFSACSSAEVTIIDTSSPLWKLEKLLFRNGNVWKVRDKKWMWKDVSLCNKKNKKAVQSVMEVGGKKKRKASLPPSNTDKKAAQERLISSNEEFYNLNDHDKGLGIVQVSPFLMWAVLENCGVDDLDIHNLSKQKLDS